MASIYGRNVHVSIFGQSHSRAIGVVVDGLPAGEHVDLDRLAKFMTRRAPGGNDWSTPRKEADAPIVLSGLNAEGNTCGAPLAMMIENTNTRPGDYANLRTCPRPGHADFPSAVKYDGEQDPTGGGHFSGRLTACIAMAGGVCLQILERCGVHVGAHLARVAGIDDARFDSLHVSADELAAPGAKLFPVIDDAAGERMKAAIATARDEDDSVGGVVECAAIGLPVGLGGPMFGGLEGSISYALFGVPAVKGVEFGAGFGASELRGSQDNDPYVIENGQVRTATNNAGGILGGISTGMPLIVRAAFKPASSIAREQDTVDLSTMQPAKIVVKGRHDPCVVPRAVPVVEAAVALALMDAILDAPGAAN